MWYRILLCVCVCVCVYRVSAILCAQTFCLRLSKCSRSKRIPFGKCAIYTSRCRTNTTNKNNHCWAVGSNIVYTHSSHTSRCLYIHVSYILFDEENEKLCSHLQSHFIWWATGFLSYLVYTALQLHASIWICALAPPTILHSDNFSSNNFIYFMYIYQSSIVSRSPSIRYHSVVCLCGCLNVSAIGAWCGLSCGNVRCDRQYFNFDCGNLFCQRR